MKKALSLFLAVLMIMSALVASVGAVDIRNPGICTCEDHDRYNPCHCCIYCENLDNDYVLDCCKEVDGTWTFCCRICNGLWDCECVECECCAEKDSTLVEPESPSLLPVGVQNSLVASFQNAMKQLQARLADFFNSVFEFLRLDEYFGQLQK